MSEDGPFKAVDNSYLRIEHFRVNPKTAKPSRKFYDVPIGLIPVKVEFNNAVDKTKHTGTTHKLTKVQYLASIMLLNEINGCVGKASDRHWMTRVLRKEFKGWSARQSGKYMERFSSYRKKYNEGKMFRGQPPPILYCWYWNENGYIQHHLHKASMLTFEFCKRELRNAKFADPRFFDNNEITMIQNSQIAGTEYKDWYVPSLAEVQAIEAQNRRPLYNSVQFLDGYRKGQGDQ